MSLIVSGIVLMAMGVYVLNVADIHFPSIQWPHIQWPNVNWVIVGWVILVGGLISAGTGVIASRLTWMKFLFLFLSLLFYPASLSIFRCLNVFNFWNTPFLLCVLHFPYLLHKRSSVMGGNHTLVRKQKMCSVLYVLFQWIFMLSVQASCKSAKTKLRHVHVMSLKKYLQKVGLSLDFTAFNYSHKPSFAISV